MAALDKKMITSIKRAMVLSGIGMGLLLGLIIGLSVSDVVKIIMGTLTALLGTFLGFDKRKFTAMEDDEYLKESHNTLFTALRAGWFGVSVVLGLLIGMLIRTNEVFTPSVSKSVKQWTDAGFSAEQAQKYIAFQRLGIDPNTGVLGPQTEVQRAHESNLFSSEQAMSLCGSTDPDQWNKNWALAKKSILALDDKALVPVVNAIEENIADDQRFSYLYAMNTLLCYMGSEETKLCQLNANLDAWSKNDATAALAAILSKLPANKQEKMIDVFGKLICQLER